MSTVAEIKEAISHLPESKRREIQKWVLRKSIEERQFTGDGLNIKETKAKIAQAEKGTFRKVNPEEQIKKLMASLE